MKFFETILFPHKGSVWTLKVSSGGLKGHLPFLALRVFLKVCGLRYEQQIRSCHRFSDRIKLGRQAEVIRQEARFQHPIAALAM